MFRTLQPHLDDAEAVIHTIKISENELRKQQVNGFYRDVELGPPGNVEKNELEKKERELDGTKKTGKQRTNLYFVRVSC